MDDATMQVSFPVQITWTMNTNHYLVKAWLSLPENEQEALLKTLITQLAEEANKGGSWAAFEVEHEKEMQDA